MSSISRLVAASLGAAAVAFGSPADAQFVRPGFGGVRVVAPGVGVSVGRFGGVRVNAPGVRVGVPGRAYYGAPVVRRYRYPVPVVAGGMVAGGPVVTGGSVVASGGVSASGGVGTSGGVVVAGGSVAAGSSLATPTPAASPSAFAGEAELTAMSGVQLTAALSSAGQALQSRLATFENGDGWQDYLQLGAAATGEFAAAEKLLRRYDSVARDAQFSMIARLEEFAAVRLTLRVLVDRGGAGAAIESAPAAADETLPTPSADPAVAPAAAAAPASGVDVGVDSGGVRVRVERSVLTTP